MKRVKGHLINQLQNGLWVECSCKIFANMNLCRYDRLHDKSFIFVALMFYLKLQKWYNKVLWKLLIYSIHTWCPNKNDIFVAIFSSLKEIQDFVLQTFLLVKKATFLSLEKIPKCLIQIKKLWWISSIYNSNWWL